MSRGSPAAGEAAPSEGGHAETTRDGCRECGRDGGATWTGWLVFCVVLPFLGVFVYVITRGNNMGSRYARGTAKGGAERASSVDELARLSEVRARGDISDEEFRRAKELVLSGSGRPGS